MGLKPVGEMHDIATRLSNARYRGVGLVREVDLKLQGVAHDLDDGEILSAVERLKAARAQLKILEDLFEWRREERDGSTDT
jgi:hypothetical protein